VRACSSAVVEGTWVEAEEEGNSRLELRDVKDVKELITWLMDFE
jgi:hypothetical protein